MTHAANTAEAMPTAARAASPLVRDASPSLAIELEVVSVSRISPSFLRLTFTSPDLARLGSRERLLDTRVKVIVPHPEHPENAPGRSVLAVCHPDAPAESAGILRWYRSFREEDPVERGYMRTYTIEALREPGDPASRTGEGELDIDFAVHPEAPGPASLWASRAKPGDRIVLVGPNRAVADETSAALEFRPGAARRVLIVGDETALPAIENSVCAIAPDAVGHVLIEVPDGADRRELAVPAGVEVEWFVHAGHARGAALSTRVRELGAAGVFADAVVREAGESAGGALDAEGDEDATGVLWDRGTAEASSPPLFAWLAGEAGVITGLRRHLVKELGVDRRFVTFMGYWRQGRGEGE